MNLIKNIQLPITTDFDLQEIIAKKLAISAASITDLQILRRSLDARKKNRLKYNFTAIANLPHLSHPDVLEYNPPTAYLQEVNSCADKHPYIIGAGPAGLFAALALTEKGYKPYIFERGQTIAKRNQKVDIFWQNGQLDPESNVQFGEGGAGTFSDGKLTSRNRDFYTNQVFDLLINFGATADIKIEAKPHLGTDKLKYIITNIRKYLQEQGCHFFWNHKLDKITVENGKLTSLMINGEKHKPACAILALGNAARDTFSHLKQNLTIIPKPFSVGVRIEHTQEYINSTFYGARTNFALTGPATYRLTAKFQKRGIYSFCMCPGGQVIAAASQPNTIVTNGMSYSSRDGKMANSALVVNLSPTDFGASALDGVQFQKQLEKTAFKPGLAYFAPVQSASDFLNNKLSEKPTSSYRPGTYARNLQELFPNFINQALKSALNKFSKRYPGFVEKGNLIAPETRTSCPIRILRQKDNFACQAVSNLFAVGEGSGYAGGIISSAADGYKLGSTFSIKK
jgi:hypothetical protein